MLMLHFYATNITWGKFSVNWKIPITEIIYSHPRLLEKFYYGLLVKELACQDHFYMFSKHHNCFQHYYQCIPLFQVHRLLQPLVYCIRIVNVQVSGPYVCVPNVLVSIQPVDAQYFERAAEFPRHNMDHKETHLIHSQHRYIQQQRIQ